jgi:hypothetical protein
VIELARLIARSCSWATPDPYQARGIVASRYPIAEVYPLARDAAGLGARLRIEGAPAHDVVVWDPGANRWHDGVDLGLRRGCRTVRD